MLARGVLNQQMISKEGENSPILNIDPGDRLRDKFQKSLKGMAENNS